MSRQEGHCSASQMGFPGEQLWAGQRASAGLGTLKLTAGPFVGVQEALAVGGGPRAGPPPRQVGGLLFPVASTPSRGDFPKNDGCASAVTLSKPQRSQAPPEGPSRHARRGQSVAWTRTWAGSPPGGSPRRPSSGTRIPGATGHLKSPRED